MGNPAMILYGHFKELPGQHSQSWPQAWKNVVGIEWMEAVGPLLELEEHTERIVNAQPGVDSARLLHHRDDWRRAILLHGVDLSKAMQTAGYQLPASSISSLYNVALYIARLPGITPEATDDLERLAGAVSSLREDVLGSTELDDDLRAFLLEQANNMQRRIDLSRVTGSGPIEDLRAEIIGSAATQTSMWDRALGSPLRTKIIAVFAALSVYNGGVATLNQSIENTEQLMQTVHSVVERIVKQPREIEGTKGPAALLPGQSENAARASGDPGSPPA